jgi:predicted CopG family antitoxin
MTNVVFHILKDGESRSTMIREIVEQLNGDQDVLAEGWENGSTEEIFELWTNLVQDVAE